MRRIISIILAISFIIVAITSVQMAVMRKPQNLYQNTVSNQGEKTIAKADAPFYPKKAHEWSGYLFIGAGLVHIVFNKKTLLLYFKH